MHNVIYGQQIYPENRINTHLKDLDGLKHHSHRSPLAPHPGETVTLTVTTSGPVSFDEIRVWYQTDHSGEAPILLREHSSSLPFYLKSVQWDQPAWDYIRTWEVQIPGQPEGAILRYRIAGRMTGSECWINADNQTQNSDEATDFAVYIGNPSMPEWARHAILYHIFLDRFYPGNGVSWNSVQSVRDFYGGTLRGVIDKMDYLQNLGVNTLWLSPLFASPTSHGYDSTDLFTVEPRLGTDKDFADLINQAHGKGIRVLLDFVPNHWSNLHPTFLDAQQNPDSAYRGWYVWQNYPQEYDAFFDVKTMPKINLRCDSPARAHVLEAARYWLEQGVDGYRLDHADGPAHDFWADFRRVCQQSNPDCWLFGEVVKPPPFQRAYFGNLHGQLDFALARALRETFATQNWNLAQFDSFISAHTQYFPSGYSRPAFLDNHDMNRFLMLAGNDLNRLKLAALVLYTLPGAPILYYGTETGLSQEKFFGDGLGFDEARLPMLWGNDQKPDLLQYFQKLINLRKANPTLADNSHQTLILNPDAGLYTYTPAPGILIALNTSPEPQTLTIPNTFLKDAKDHLNDSLINSLDDHLEIHLAPQTGAFIT